MEDVNKEVVETETIESTTQGPPVEEAKLLPMREALEVAMEVHRPESEKKVVEVEKQVKQASEPVKTSTLNPPAEWSKEEKEDFLASSPKAQEAALRLHNRRQSTLEEIKREKEETRREKEENAWTKQLVSELTPFLKTRGGKEPTHTQIINALKVVNQVDTDTKAAVVDILKAKGMKVPDELLEDTEKNNVDVKINPIQERLNVVEMELAQERLAKTRDNLANAWQSFESQKNAAGLPKFPDVDNTESGIALASSIGSLVLGKHNDSVGFLAYMKARIPNYDTPKLIEEAYKWFGGKVDESTPAKTQSLNKHQIIKSNRAASSTPGRGVQQINGQIKGKAKTLREALEMSYRQLTEE